MLTTDLIENHRKFVISASIGLLVVIVFVLRSLMSVPQMSVDEETFKTVDALFTALTSRDLRRLDECEKRLNAKREDGMLPVSAAKFLDKIINQARSGQWEPSAHSLYDFMLAQRRTP